MDHVHHQTLSESTAPVKLRRSLVHGAIPQAGPQPILGHVLEGLPRWTTNPELYAFAWTGDFSGTLDPLPPSDVYRASAALELNPKPAVAWMSGTVGERGAVLALFGTHRVAAHDTQICFDSTARGQLPAPGLAWFLTLRGARGLAQALLLTGTPIDASTALAMGLLTHMIDPVHQDDVLQQLELATPIDPLLDARRAPVASPEPNFAGLAPQHLDLFTGTRSFPDLVRGVAQAQAAAPDDRWLAEATARLTSTPPDLGAAVLGLIARAATGDIDHALALDWALSRRWARGERPNGNEVAHLFVRLRDDDIVVPQRPPNVHGAE